MKLAVKIFLFVAASMTIYVILISFYKRPPITKGFITNMWIVPAHLDVRLRSPGVWEQAWLDTQYWIEIQSVATRRYRRMEVHPSMQTAYNIGQWIELGDSATYARKKAEADEKAAMLKRTGRDTVYYKAQERKLILTNPN